MGVWQPCMEWKHRHLDGKAQEEGRKEPELIVQRQNKSVPVKQRKTPLACNLIVKIGHKEHADKHHKRTCKCIEEELDRCIDAKRSTPRTDDIKHRNKRKLPKYIRDDRIKCGKNTHHRHLQEKQRNNHVLFVFRFRQRGDPYHRKERCKNDDKKRDTVNPYYIIDPKRRNERNRLHKLHSRYGWIVQKPKHKREYELYN